MEEKEELNPQESLAIIQNMIATAKHQLADDGFYLLLWGWLVFASAMVHYMGLQIEWYAAGVVWAITMPIGGIVSVIYSRKEAKTEHVKTYLSSYLGYLWTAFGIALALTLLSMNTLGIGESYFFVMILYGMATFISGGLLQFKPLVIGGLCSFVCAIVSVFTPKDHILLILAASLLLSYIIPGHLLRKLYKSALHV